MKRLLIVISIITCLFSLFYKAQAQTNQIVANGASTTAANFPGTGCTYNWTNNTPGIGLAASGTGNIASFTAVNAGSTPVTATITATPVSLTFAYITNSTDGTVSVINTVTNTVVATITVGSNPWGVSVSPDGSRVYVTNWNSNNVSVINTATNTVTATIPVGTSPIGISVSPDGSKAYVANLSDGTVSVINTTTNTVLATISVGSNPFDLVVSPDGSKVYVTNDSIGTVTVINTATNTVAATLTTGADPFCIAISPDGSTLYVSNSYLSTISAISTSTNTVVATITIGASGSANGLVVTPDGSKLYANLNDGTNYVAVINTSTNTVITTIPEGSDPSGISVSPDGSLVYSTIRFSNYVSVISTATNAIVATIPVGNGPLSLGNFVTGGAGCAPVTFTITVNPSPGITAGTASGSISACAGAASVSPNIQQVTVSGSYLTSNITATAPAGFEVSLSAGSGYGNSVTLTQAGGTVSNTIVYVRSAASASGSISGNVVLSSTGATSQNVAVTGTVNALPTVNTVSNQTLVNGAATAAVNFTGTANTFNWTNNTPGIGLAASGTGNIASFAAVNTGSSPVTATITITPFTVGYAYITNLVSNDVSVINTATNTVVATIPVGPGPYGASVSPDGSRVYVTNTFSTNVSVISTATNAVIATITVGNSPRGLWVSPDGSRVYVANNGSNTVSVINTATNTVVATIPVGASPSDVSVSPDGSRAYVANQGDGTVSVINTTTNAAIATITAGTGPTGIIVSPNGSMVYVTDISSNTVSVISTATNAVVATVGVGSGPGGVTISPDGSTVYVTNIGSTNVSVINTATNAVSATITVGTSPRGISVSPDGSQVYVANYGSNNVSVINTTTNTVSATVPVGTSPNLLDDFITRGTSCSGTPFTFTITVDPTQPTISTTGSPASLTTTYGTASSSTSFNVSGTNMTSGILVTPPPGFEVSADNITFSSTVTVGAAGTIASMPVYIRLASSPAVGNYSGNIVLSSPGASTVSVAMPFSTVNPAPLTITASNVTKTYGTILTGSSGSTAYTITSGALQNGNTINSVSIAYGAGSATDPVGTYTGLVTANSATGANGFLSSNYTITYAPGNIIATPAALTITANNVTKTYGTVLTGSSGSSAFTATGLQNSETIGSLTIAYGTGSAAADAVGTYTGSVTASAPTGGTFTAGNYTVTYVSGNIIVTPAALTITANNVTKTYGTALTGSSGSTAFTATGLQNSETVGSLTIAYGTGSAAADAVGTYTGSVTASAPTGGTFTAGNYTVTYVSGNIIVTPAALTITANNVTKTYGTVLTRSSGSSAFTAPGLQNSETIGSVTIAYGTGSAAADAVGTYTGSVTASAPTGGTFTAGNYTVTYVPGDININAAPSPTISATGSPASLSTSYGAASASTSFNVSGASMTAGILVTPPPGFEVSTDNITFSSTVTVGAAGTVASTPVYIRLASGTAVGSYSGNIVLSSAGTANVNVATVNSTVTALLSVITSSTATGAISACVGSASASPNIQQFTVSGINLTDVITATAPPGFEISFSATGTYGSSVSISEAAGTTGNTTLYIRSAATDPAGNISGNVVLTSPGATTQNVAVSGVVNALPTVNPVANQTVNAGASTTAINFTGTGNTFTWTNNTPGIGLAASGTGNIAAFTAVNTGSTPVTATIMVTPAVSGYAYIANRGSNNVSVINLVTNTVTTTIPVGVLPLGVSVSPDGSKVFVTNNTDGTVSVINTATNAVTATINVSPNPSTIAVSPDGSQVYVASSNPDVVSVINTTTNSVTATINIGLNPPYGLAVSPDGSRLYVAFFNTNTVSVISTATNTVISSITTGFPYTSGISVSPDGSKVYVANASVSNLSVVNAATNAVIVTISVGTSPLGTAISPDGSRVYVTNSNSNTVSVINTATNAVIASIPVDTYPNGISISNDGSRLYVANSNSNDVSVINTLTNTVIATIPVGSNPISFGNFISNATICPGTPATFTITVNQAPPTITASTATGNISTCIGSPSASPNIQQFTVTGSGLTGNITATAPAGFEISLNANSGYGNNTTFTQTGGAVNNIIVYVRSAATDPAGNISGNVVLTSPGATTQNVAVSGVVNALPTVNPVANQTVNAGQNTTAINFTGTGNTYTWTNNTPGIGLPASGTGNIPAFTGANTGSTPVTATITVTPMSMSTTGCTGPPITCTITVNPAPIPVIAASGTLTALNTTYGTPSSSTSFTVSGAGMNAGILVTPPPGFEVSTDNTNFSSTVTVGAAGNIASATVYIRLAQTTNAGTYSGNVVLSSVGATNVNVATANSTVDPAPLTITANSVTKPYGSTLTSGPGSTAFATVGLKNNETIGSVTITYGSGAAAGDPPGPYGGSVTASAATGGTFNPANYTISYVRGSIEVVVLTTITVAGSPSGLNTIYGTASSATSFTVTGANLTAGILVTPPPGFEVSTNNISFSSTVTAITSGNISPVPVYIRLAATTPVGNYSGNIVLSSAGAVDVDVAMPNSFVGPAPLIITANNATKAYGTPNPIFSASYLGFVNGDTQAQLTEPPTFSTIAVTLSPVGDYPIIVNGGASPNYTITRIPGTLTIIAGLASIEIPNAFTPNGDGVNDVWDIKSLIDFPECTVAVYTRYGSLVFQSRGYTRPWDGTSKGSPVPTGTYYYIINTQVAGQKLLSGFVAVLR